MRFNRILPLCLCLCSAGACAQTASVQVERTASPSHSAGAINFNYDAQHDQLLATGIAFSASPRQASGITPTTGMIVVTLNITPISHFEKGTSFHCSLIAVGGILDLSNGVVDGGMETANTVARSGSGGTTVCTLKIPYSWMIPPDPGGSTGMILAFGVAAFSPHENGGLVHRSTLQLGGVESLPANGSTTNFSFDVVL